jgi:glutamate-1-semialdehyde aminotransferase
VHAGCRAFCPACARSPSKHGALLIFDEVKTGAKLGWGGASEYFGVRPDMICLAKSIGGGLPLAAFATSRTVMSLISDHKVFHGGTYNTNPVSMAAGLATFHDVLTRENYAHVDQAEQPAHRGLSQDRGQGRPGGIRCERGRKWRFDALSDAKSGTTGIGRRSMSISGVSTGSPW